MVNKTSKIDVRFPLREKDRLASMATRARISTGELIRRLSTGAELPVYGKHEAVNEMIKTRGDLARLGNLFKLAINQLSQALNDGKVNPDKVGGLIDDISTGRRKIMRSHQELQEKIQKL